MPQICCFLVILRYCRFNPSLSLHAGCAPSRCGQRRASLWSLSCQSRTAARTLPQQACPPAKMHMRALLVAPKLMVEVSCMHQVS